MEATNSLVLPKPAYRVLHRLTGESRPEVALSVALKDLARFRIQAARSRIDEFESRYGMKFIGFSEAWKSGRIENPYSYDVEKDFWDWEAATTDLAALEELSQWLI